MEALELLEKKISKCQRCSRLREVTPIPYPHIFYGDMRELSIFCVGRNAGLEHNYAGVSREEFMDVYHKRWWKCRFANYLRQHLGDNLVKANVFFTNVCKCSSPNNEALTINEIHNCNTFLRVQLKLIKPQIILAFGSDAKYALQQIKSLPCKVLFLYHPAYFIYAKNPRVAEGQALALHKIRDEYQ